MSTLIMMQVYVTPTGGYAPVYASMPAGGELSYVHSLSLWRHTLTARCLQLVVRCSSRGTLSPVPLRIPGCAAQLA